MSTSLLTPPSAGADASGPLARFTRAAASASARRPKLVLCLWLALIVTCSIGGAITGTRSLSNVAEGTGQSGQAERTLERSGLLNRFNETVIVSSTSAAQTQRAVAAIAARARGARYVTTVAAPTAGGTRDGGRVALISITLRGSPDAQADRVVPLQRAVAAVAAAHPAVQVGEAGDGSMTRAQNSAISSGLTSAGLIALPVTFLILMLVFGAFAAAVVPLLLGLTSVGAAMGALGLVSQIAPNGSTTSSVVLLIGLAVGVDYSLFYIRRERAERAGGADRTAALTAAAATVGRAVLIAGATVIAGLVGLLFTGNPVFVSMALGAILVVAIAVLGSLTVLPAALTLLGRRLDGRRRRLGRGTRARARAADSSSPWERAAAAVTARPRFSLAVGLAVMALLAVPVLGMRIANPGSADLPPSNATVTAEHQIDRFFPGGSDTAELVVSGSRLGSPAARAALHRLGAEGERLTGGRGGDVSVAVAGNARTAVIDIPVPSGGSAVQSRNVNLLRSRLEPETARLLPGASAQLGGDDAGNVDFNHQMDTMTPLVIGFVLVLAFLLLISAFGSPLLALAVIGLNLASVGAAFGVLTALFQYHWAETLFGLRSFGAIAAWLPLFAFVVLFGLSMDYTVLILERASEARRRGASARAAATEALGATGPTVTSAALVMVAVFATFAAVPLVSFKQMGIGLAAAIAVDATLVRAVALPAALALLGDHGLRPVRQPRGRPDAWDHEAYALAHGVGND